MEEIGSEVYHLWTFWPIIREIHFFVPHIGYTNFNWFNNEIISKCYSSCRNCTKLSLKNKNHTWEKTVYPFHDVHFVGLRTADIPDVDTVVGRLRTIYKGRLCVMWNARLLRWTLNLYSLGVATCFNVLCSMGLIHSCIMTTKDIAH